MPIRVDEIRSNGAAPADLTVTCGAEKTLVLDTPVWGNISTSAGVIRLPASGVYNPTETLYKTGLVLAFGDEATNEEEVRFEVIMQPDYLEGSNIIPRVHWVGEDNTAGSVRWGLEYTWANVDDAFPSTSTIYIDDANGDTDVHARASFAAITGTGMEISSALLCRLFRNSSNAADTLTGKSAYLIDFDIRYQIDTLGSRTETAK